MAEAAEIAWSQGVNLYSLADNRLLKGFEYTAKYNLGHDVPFVRYKHKTGKYDWETLSEQGRGRLRPIFEEGAAFQADHPGFGTLFFTLA